MSQDPILEFRYELDAFDPNDPSVLRSPDYDIEGAFSVVINEKTLCQETMVCPVEFAMISAAWMHSLKRQPWDLVYQPEGYAEDYFFKIIAAEGGWQILPLKPLYNETRLFSESSLVKAVTTFIDKLSLDLKGLTDGKLDISQRLGEQGIWHLDEYRRINRLYVRYRELPFPELSKTVGDFGFYDAQFAGVFQRAAGGEYLRESELPVPDDDTRAFVEQLRRKAAKLPDERKFLEYYDLMEEIRHCYLKRR